MHHTVDYGRAHVTPLLKATHFIDQSFSTDPYQFANTKARCTVDAVSLLAHAIAKSLVGTFSEHVFMTLLAAGFAAKGLLILLTSGSVATGLAHSIPII